MTVLASALSNEVLREAFDPETLRRGRAYLQDRRILQLSAHNPDDASTISGFAVVAGSHHAPYVVRLVVEDRGDHSRIETTCTCPVHQQCKHGAAALLKVRDSLPDGDVLWRRRFDSLIADLGGDTRPGHGERELALQIGISTPRRSYYSTSRLDVLLRPLQRGAKKNWIKTGIGWRDVPAATLRGEHRPVELDLFSRMYSALSASDVYWSSQPEASLSSFGQPIWSLLATAAEIGLPLVLDRHLASVEFLDHGFDVAADIVDTGDGATFRVALSRGDESWHGTQVDLVGTPAHGAACLRGQHLVIGPLSTRLPVAWKHLIEDPQPLRVPANGVEELRQQYLPRLTRLVSVGSSDDSVTVEAPAPAELLLQVTWDGVEATTEWRWRYGDRTTSAADDLGGLRDRVAEHRIWSTLRDDGVLDAFAATGRDAPVPVQRWKDAHALGLTDDVLPALRRHPSVEVVEADGPTFRETTEAVEIRFDVDEGGEGATDWLDLSITLTVEGQQIPLADVLSALTIGEERIFLPSGLHLSTDRPEFKSLADLVRSAAELREADSDTVSVGHHDLGLWAQLADLGIVDAQASTWVQQAQALRDLVTLPTPEPVGIVSTLRSYQLDGFHWLAFLWEQRLGGILADDMGLGKTLQVLALINHARARGAGKFLVVAPTSVVSAWQSEAARHAPDLRIAAVTASASRRGSSIASLAEDADVVVTTYTLLRLEAEQYDAVEWGGLILDEAQQVKNHQGKTYQAARKLSAPFKLAVTGTPFENRLMELWSLLSITSPGLYPWPKKFTENVVRPVEKEGNADALRRLRQRIRPFLLRRTKELVAADLPPKQEQVLEVPLGSRHRKIYDTHLQKERQKVLGLVGDFEHNRVAIFSALTRMRQLALDPGLVDQEYAQVGSAKLDALVEHLLEVTAEGHRALVFSQFTSFLALARTRLDEAGVESAYLDGRTRKRGDVIEQFRTGNAPVFLISLKAGGVGLTLTEADYVFVLDPWWNPAAEAQAVDRAHRIGQTKSVMVYRLVATNTIEEKVMALKARKADLFAQVVDGDGAMSTALTAEDVRGLFEG